MTSSHTPRLPIQAPEGIKSPVATATIADTDLQGLQTINGYQLNVNDRVLVMNQVEPAQNGIYSAQQGRWTRTQDWKVGFQIANGVLVLDINTDVLWRASFAGVLKVDATPVTFTAVVSGAGSLKFIQEDLPINNVEDGDEWYKPSEATTYIYYVDEDGGQWVEQAVQSAEGTLRDELAATDSDVLVGGVESGIIANAISNRLGLGPQTTSVPVSTSKIRVEDGSTDGALLYPFENNFSSLQHTITDIQTNNFGGYDVTTNQGVFELVTLEILDYRRDLDARGWGLTPEDKASTPTENQTARILKIRDYIKSNFVVIKVPSGNYLCDGDALDFRDCTVGGFVGAGVDKTTFYAATDNTSTAWFNLGTDGGPFEPTTSDVQFGDFGGFSLRCNGRNITKACSHNFFRRGSDRDVRVYDAGTSFSYDYGWLNTFGPMRSQNHKSVGHRFGGSSLNAVTFNNLEASSNVPNVRDYSFENPNTVLLVSPDAEGAGGGFYFQDGRSVTLLNLHSEAENTKLRTVSNSVNGLCINVVGGAAFNAPTFFALPNSIQALTLTNFGLYDVGVDFSGISWQINAKKVVVNNLNVVDSNKNKATRKQVRGWLLASLGTNVDFCSLDGEILRSNGVNTLVNESDRYFTLATTPSTPIDIPTAADIERTTAEITISQRLNASQDAAVRILATVSSDGTFTQSEIANINNVSAGIVLGYNSSTKRFTVDSSFGISTKIKVEYWRN